jgi:hypothetical protein
MEQPLPFNQPPQLNQPPSLNYHGQVEYGAGMYPPHSLNVDFTPPFNGDHSYPPNVDGGEHVPGGIGFHYTTNEGPSSSLIQHPYLQNSAMIA